MTLVSAEVREAVYEQVHACTSDAPQTAVKKKSKLECAIAGVRELRYRDFTFDETTKECSIYRHIPLLYKISSLVGLFGYHFIEKSKLFS